MAIDAETIKQLLGFIEERDRRFLKTRLPFGKNEVQILSRTVKLGEEVGELYNEILRYLGLQRQDKLDGFKIEDLEDEFSDALITLLVLASRIPEMNLSKAVKRKIEVIKERDRQAKRKAD
ncbi:MAG: hypothetical protein GXP43_01375 [bacterium]|nr:hypothetical protein [bacterium]